MVAPNIKRILEEVVSTHPDPMSREDLAAACNVSAISSTYRNNLGRLSSLGLVTYPEPGQIRAADLLFPDRRASA